MDNGPKFEPVAWLTAASGVLLAIQAADEVTNLLPDRVAAWVAFLSIAVVALLGFLARKVTTPLADPKAADGRLLVPSPPARVSPDTPLSELDATTSDSPYEDPEDPQRGRYGTSGW